MSGFSTETLPSLERPVPRPPGYARVRADGKFLQVAASRFLVKGVTYGTFAPDADGYQFPSRERVAEDFRLMASLGINTVRTYTAPRLDLLDEAASNGLRVMVGLPWSQHVAFLDDSRLTSAIRKDIASKARAIGSHPAVLIDRKSTRLNSSHVSESRMPSSA